MVETIFCNRRTELVKDLPFSDVVCSSQRLMDTLAMWLWGKIRSTLSRFIPKHVNDPIGLVGRMLLSKQRAAKFTLWVTALGIALIPIDWAFQFVERLVFRKKKTEATGPHIIVCGPARSGTTLVYQVLADALPVIYVKNLTTLFPRAPLLATRLFSRETRPDQQRDYQNYYGKTDGLQAASEANHLWNQWVDADDSGFRTKLTTSGADAMKSFLGQFSAIFNKPTLSKNNNINAFADEIANKMDHVHFICLRRDARYLAQSLIKARLEINGDVAKCYGVNEGDSNKHDDEPVLSVLEQIRYLDELAVQQQQKIGKEHFWIVDYESFCARPTDLINQIKQRILKMSESEISDVSDFPAITHHNRIDDIGLFNLITYHLGKETRTDISAIRKAG